MLETTISTPIIVGDRVFTLARPMTLVCIDKNTGEELWRRERHIKDGETVADDVRLVHDAIVRDTRIHELKYRLHMRGAGPVLDGVTNFEQFRGRGPTKEKDEAYFRALQKQNEALWADGEANRAAYTNELAVLEASIPKDERGRIPRGTPRGTGYATGAGPASDGERVVACFKPGLVVSYDLEGNLLWTRAILDKDGREARGGKYGTYAEVPLCADGKVLVAFRTEFRCFDAATGELIWSQTVDRNETCGAATPSMGNAGGGWYFMTVGGHVRSLKDGTRALTADPPIGACQDYAMAVDPEGRTLHCVGIAVRLPEKPDQMPRTLWALEPKLRWPPPRGVKLPKDHMHVVGDSHAYCAPVVHDGLVYHRRTGGGGIETMLDAETGEPDLRASAERRQDQEQLRQPRPGREPPVLFRRLRSVHHLHDRTREPLPGCGKELP